MTPKENMNLDKLVNEFYKRLIKYVLLRGNVHDIETNDFVAKKVLHFLVLERLEKIKLIIY